jgi:spore coat protein U-like protein
MITTFPGKWTPSSIWMVALGLLSATALGISAPSKAATATSSLSVTATVVATCVVSTTPLAFGNYVGSQSDSTATLSITCTNTTPYNVGLGVGLGTSATVTTRKMTGPSAAVLAYALFSDSGRAVNWGSTVATDTVGGTGNGSVQTMTIYGRIAAGLYVAPGAYTDTVTATVTF